MCNFQTYLSTDMSDIFCEMSFFLLVMFIIRPNFLADIRNLYRLRVLKSFWKFEMTEKWTVIWKYVCIANGHWLHVILEHDFTTHELWLWITISWMTVTNWLLCDILVAILVTDKLCDRIYKQWERQFVCIPLVDHLLLNYKMLVIPLTH